MALAVISGLHDRSSVRDASLRQSWAFLGIPGHSWAFLYTGIHRNTQEDTGIHRNSQEYTGIHGNSQETQEYTAIHIFLCIPVHSCAFLGIPGHSWAFLYTGIHRNTQEFTGMHRNTREFTGNTGIHSNTYIPVHSCERQVATLVSLTLKPHEGSRSLSSPRTHAVGV